MSLTDAQEAAELTEAQEAAVRRVFREASEKARRQAAQEGRLAINLPRYELTEAQEAAFSRVFREATDKARRQAAAARKAFAEASEKARRQAALERRLATNQPRYAQRLSVQRWPGSSYAEWVGKSEPWMTDQVKAVEVEMVTSWLDSVAAVVGPDPQSAGTVEEFVAQLRLLYEWAGDPTLRELEKRAGTGRLPRSSVNDMLRRTSRLPKIDLMTEFVKACGAEAALPAWIAAWHRLKRPRPARAAARQLAA